MLFTLPELPALSSPSGKFLLISTAHKPVTSLLMTSRSHTELVTSVFSQPFALSFGSDHLSCFWGPRLSYVLWGVLCLASF